MFTPDYINEEKKRIVDECMASGLSIAEFCKRKGINDSVFDGWLIAMPSLMNWTSSLVLLQS